MLEPEAVRAQQERRPGLGRTSKLSSILSKTPRFAQNTGHFNVSGGAQLIPEGTFS